MDESETWKVIPGFHEYAVSDHGRVKRILPCPMPNGRGFKPMRILKPATAHGGYDRVFLYAHGIGHRLSVHRLVLSTFVRAPHPKDVANHLDGNKQNNRLKNLEWTTASANELHAVALGLKQTGDRHWSRRHPERVAYGSRNGYSKLHERDVREIRRRYVAQYGVLTALAKAFGVSDSTIFDIVHRRHWRHIPAHKDESSTMIAHLNRRTR